MKAIRNKQDLVNYNSNASRSRRRKPKIIASIWKFTVILGLIDGIIIASYAQWSGFLTPIALIAEPQIKLCGNIFRILGL